MRSSIRLATPILAACCTLAAVAAHETASAPPSANVSISKTAPPEAVEPGANVTFQLSVANAGPSRADDVIVTDTLPPELSFVSCSSTGGGSCRGGGQVRMVTFEELDKGASASITIEARVSGLAARGASLANRASVRTKDRDPDASDNVSEATVSVAGKTDVVLIVTDDQAWHTLQFMPHTNALIGDAGVRFSRAFATTPLCCPSRSSILKGQYAHNHGVLGNTAPLGGAGRFNDASTLATWLKSEGYHTGLFGKYLNGYAQLTPWPYVPPGWVDWRAFKNPGYFAFTLVENGVEVRYGRAPDNYSGARTAEMAVQFIDSAPAGTPIFLYYAPFAPHEPAEPAPEDAGTFAGLPPWRPASFNEADVSDKPKWVRALPLLSPAQQDSIDALYRKQVESLQSVDRAVLAIVDALERNGRLANTAIVFTSDNGWSQGAHRWELKNCVYEDCVRVPMLVRAPGVLPRDDGHLVLNVDLAPTIAQWAGIVPPDPVNGRSLVPLLANAGTPWRDGALLEVLAGGASRTFQAVRTAQYLYAEYHNGDRELYDLALDPDQLQNVVNDPSYASVLPDLQAKLASLEAE